MFSRVNFATVPLEIATIDIQLDITRRVIKGRIDRFNHGGPWNNWSDHSIRRCEATVDSNNYKLIHVAVYNSVSNVGISMKVKTSSENFLSGL